MRLDGESRREGRLVSGVSCRKCYLGSVVSCPVHWVGCVLSGVSVGRACLGLLVLFCRSHHIGIVLCQLCFIAGVVSDVLSSCS